MAMRYVLVLAAASVADAAGLHARSAAGHRGANPEGIDLHRKLAEVNWHAKELEESLDSMEDDDAVELHRIRGAHRRSLGKLRSEVQEIRNKNLKIARRRADTEKHIQKIRREVASLQQENDKLMGKLDNLKANVTLALDFFNGSRAEVARAGAEHAEALAEVDAGPAEEATDGRLALLQTRSQGTPVEVLVAKKTLERSTSNVEGLAATLAAALESASAEQNRTALEEAASFEAKTAKLEAERTQLLQEQTVLVKQLTDSQALEAQLAPTVEFLTHMRDEMRQRYDALRGYVAQVAAPPSNPPPSNLRKAGK